MPSPSLTGLKLWLKAGAGVTQSGGLVSAWADQSGNGNDVAQASGGLQPSFVSSSINGLPALTFDVSKYLGSTSTSVLPSGSARSVIVVAKSPHTGTGTNTGGIFVGFRSSVFFWNAQLSNQPGDGNTYVYGSGSTPATLVTPWSFTTNPFLFEEYGTVGSPLSVNVNGTALPVTGGNAVSDSGSAGVYIGNYFGGTVGFQGDIAEVLVYDHVLSSDEIATVREYVQLKYAISLGITTLSISPSSASVPAGTTHTFTGVNGSGSGYTYSLAVNNSGGSIDSSTGVYRAGSTGSVSDTVRVTDSAAATADAVVSVTGTAPPTGGIRLWLKADSVTGTDGDAVSSWPDLSGGSHDASQATGANRPVLKTGSNGLNGHNIIRFDGSASYMTGSFPVSSSDTGFTTLYVVRTGATVSGQGGQATVLGSSIHATSGVRWSFGCANSGIDGAGWGGTDADVNLGAVTGIAPNTTFVGQYRYDKANWVLSGLNTGTYADTSFFTGSSFSFVLGNEGPGTAPYWFDGDIAEVIIYDHKLSDADLAAAMSYLNARYSAGALSIDPTATTIAPLQSVFGITASGGNDAGDPSNYVFSVVQNQSGGNLTDNLDGTAQWDAGGADGIDIVRVTDLDSNTADCTITVTSGPPLSISPTPVSVSPFATQLFTASGGDAPYVFTLPTSPSGGSIVDHGDGTATYTAGGNPNETDFVRVTDFGSNTADAEVDVGSLPPVQISPATPTVSPLGSITFTAVDGEAPFTFTYTANNSDGTLVDNGDGTASYTAGSLPSCTDTVRVTDNLSATADATITVGPGVSTTPATGVHINPGVTQLFTASGGSGTGYVFLGSLLSGGTLVDHGDGTATYTAGTVSNTADDINVTDSLGNQYDCNVIVPGPRLTPANPTNASPRQVISFSVSGGLSPWTFTLPVNNSGATLVDHGNGTATYTAGPTGSVNDVVIVTDAGSNEDITLVQVGPVLAISPSVSTVPPGGSETFSHSGGGGSFTYSLHVNNSGGSINSSTGVYTAGHTGGVSDTVRVTDAYGATADATVSVSASLAIVPSSFECNSGQGRTFGATGGSGTGYGFSLTTNNSGGTVNATTGVYVSGTNGTVTVTDVIQLHDSLGNTASVTILVHPPQPPTFFLRQVAPMGMSTIRVTFSHAPRAADPTDPTDALNPDNYTLTGPVIDYIVRVTEVVGDPNSVDCSLGAPMKPGSWSLSARNIKDSNGIETI